MTDFTAALEQLPTLAETVRRYDLAPKKSLGQNFLFDLNLTRKIAREAMPLAGYSIVEVGPGPGGLTRALFYEGAEQVTVIEKDARATDVLSALKECVGADNFHIKMADALEVDFNTLSPTKKIKLVANLPYNISTALLVGWLEKLDNFASLTLMFQKEVAERICAAPGTKKYGRISVLSQWLCDVRLCFDIPKEAFTPPPKITSTVVQLVPKKQPLDADLRNLEKVTQAAFGQRRKMLRQSLKSLLGPETESRLQALNIKPTSRAEELSVAQFIEISNSL